MNFHLPLAALAATFCLATSALRAQVPQLINYQGRVAVGTVNFDGTGSFKFALVNGDGTVTFWSNDGTSAAGSEPTAAVPLTVTKGLYSVLLGDAALANMTAIPNSVFNNADVRLRVWFNDGTNGSQMLAPDQRIAAVGYAMMAGGVNMPPTNGTLTAGVIRQDGVPLIHTHGQNNFFAGTFAGVVTNGESNTAIGSFALTNNNTGGRNTSVGSQSMQANIDGGHNTALGNQALAANTSGGFNTALGELALRNNLTGLNNTAVGRDALKNSVGHNNIALGSGSGENLTTGDDNIALGNAGVAGESGRIRIGTDGTHTDTYLAGTIHGDGSGLSGINGANLAAGSITSAQIAEGAVGGTQLAPGAVQGANLASGAAAANLSASGLAGVPTGGIVLSQTENPALAGAGYVKIGSLPAEDTWELRAGGGAPPARRSHSAVWTGSEMIVWGGDNGSGIFSNGARFDPAGNGWTPLSLFGTPDGRLLHTAVWTGTEMIVWGGSNNAILNTGGRYNPVSNTWLPVSTHNAPGVRNNHTAVWTGSEMIVWGGFYNDGSSQYRNDGGRYNPATDT